MNSVFGSFIKKYKIDYESIFNALLLLIAVTLIFRKFSTLLILVFVGFNVFNYKKLNYNRQKLIWLAIVASPLLLDIIFFWNNSSYALGYKEMEKRLSLLFFPLFILGYPGQFNLKKFLQWYAFIMVAILIILYIRFAVLFPDYVIKYFKGIHLWEMGYTFSESFGIHAPALNMHMSFVSISCLYLFFNRRKGKTYFWLHIFFLLMSFIIVMYVNTRVALITTLLGYIVVCYMAIFKKQNIVKALKISLILLLFVIISLVVFIKVFPFYSQKFTEGSFARMDMVGRLDEIEHPEVEVFSKLVTRVSIWKSALELAAPHWLVGYGASDAQPELVNYYKKTNQKFLATYKFPTHNQYIDFLLKFGVLGILVVLFYILSIGFLGIKLNNPIAISFCLLFFISNLTDDFLIRYDGITFSGLWFSIFANVYCNKHKLQDYIGKN